MDVRDGSTRSHAEVEAMGPEDRAFMRPIRGELTRNQRRTMKIGRNDPCPCKSGAKFKKCCLLKKAS